MARALSAPVALRTAGRESELTEPGQLFARSWASSPGPRNRSP